MSEREKLIKVLLELVKQEHLDLVTEGAVNEIMKWHDDNRLSHVMNLFSESEKENER